MAAAPAEVPPPAKRMKQDTSCLETIAAAGGWSSLPDELVRRIADSFLPTNDLDHYVCFRAVCPNWRRATDDPKNDADHRFRPLLWIVLDDEVLQSDDDDTRILLNTATGRFLHKKLPLLLDYHVVATHGAFFVLADRSPPHAAAVFNPLTGHLVSFAAPMPPEVTVAFVCSCRETGSLSLFLLGDSSRKRYTAVTESESFVSREVEQVAYNCLRKELVGGANPNLGLGFDGFIHELGNLVRFLHGDFAKVFSADLPGDASDDCIRCFSVGLETHMPLILKYRTLLFVYEMNSKIGKLVRMESINNFAIFIGHRRCLPVDAYDFPGIEANCVYFTEHLGSSAHIYKYNIKDNEAEMISEAPEFVKRGTKFVLVTDRPFTIIQLLCSYTINYPDSQLALQHMS